MWMKPMSMPTTNGGDGKPNFRDVFTAVTFDHIAVGTARKEELQFVKGLDAWKMKPRSDAMRHMRRAPYGTRWLDHNKGDTWQCLSSVGALGGMVGQRSGTAVQHGKKTSVKFRGVRVLGNRPHQKFHQKCVLPI